MNVAAIATSSQWILAQAETLIEDLPSEPRTMTNADASELGKAFAKGLINELTRHGAEPSTPKPDPQKIGEIGALTPKDQFEQWYHAAKTFLAEQGVNFALKLLAAVAIFFIGRILARMATKIVSDIMERIGTDPILVKFGANLLYCALLVMIGMASLEMLGVSMTSASAILAAAGFAVALALQGSLGNFAAGIMLIVFKPFTVGDEVEAGGETGNVEEVNIFDTIMRTNGNVKIIIPNGQITNHTIKNFTAQRIRLIELKVGCGYCDDLKAVKAFLDKIVRGDVRIVTTPPPAVSVADLSDFSVVFSVKCWVATKEFGDLRSVLLERIKLGFDEQGFTFPYPSRDVYVHQTNVGLAKAA